MYAFAGRLHRSRAFDGLLRHARAAKRNVAQIVKWRTRTRDLCLRRATIKHRLGPTIAETIPGFEASAWFGLVAPQRTPAPALAKLRSELEAVPKMPDVRRRFSDLGAEPGAVFGDAFGQFLTDETTKWGKIIEASGATADSNASIADPTRLFDRDLPERTLSNRNHNQERLVESP